MRVAEAHSLAYHQAVAERLRREPDLLSDVRIRVLTWLARQDRSRHYAEEWLRIVDAGLPAVLAVLEGPSWHDVDLRHASPFAGLLPPQDRWRIWRSIPHDPERDPGRIRADARR
ncbi:hypothetical protein LVJ94_22585 [Pendulispora rubella]|uniref:Uncharacterized protein n=1 Tax=Pendulispora rubella TaxID=2741070 RepID=A0ABZ2LMC1_9BACT